MVGEGIERRLDILFIGVIGGLRADPVEPAGALLVIVEEAVDIDTFYEPVRGRRAILSPILHAKDGAFEIRADCAANMHLIAAKGGMSADMGPGDRRQGFFLCHDRADIEKTETGHASAVAFHSVRIINPVSEHLISAANSEHMAATPDMGFQIDIPPLRPEGIQIGDGCL